MSDSSTQSEIDAFFSALKHLTSMANDGSVIAGTTLRIMADELSFQGYLDLCQKDKDNRATIVEDAMIVVARMRMQEQ